MKITKTMTDFAINKELFRRLEVYRQARGISQEALVDSLGISRPTYARLEKGTCSFSTFIAVLRQLNLLEGLDALVPEPTMRPSDIIAYNSKRKVRHSSGVAGNAHYRVTNSSNAKTFSQNGVRAMLANRKKFKVE
ncbi:helix-turn-helix domain-containing protein [Dickeya solani]|uniref:helix-turn-helix domain-containing protein n=1 Tax=Dickeya solani TaxID=1089444 RepID=UPI0008FBDF1E|nr:helix-turn-helix transcriptional regulator [Dickeya solani]MBJ2332962.1 helix-turn-helix domain-containing protein [Dickeya solani]MBJ2338956.1 helix-turn-helix domain-containing protein [Dickeya solani]MBJ2341846.1 helix-turn-helix domain-containing protein [Dickeya solani]MBJ2352831.1 helix-turn-helix domain-containing protein [Dickeya solani]MCZ0785717.1 helix-turn-helix transcriptional regulator [Dickeya solani]